MAKITINLCDVKPCTFQADREFEVNGQPLFVCGEQCFTKFWSREYGNWKESRYRMHVAFHHLTLVRDYDSNEAIEKKKSIEIFRSDLKIVKRQQG